MSSAKGKGYYRVELNNSDTLVAFAKLWTDPTKAIASSNLYVVISKPTGVVTEITEIAGLDFGKQPEQWMLPLVNVGHCSLEQP